jgi:hypothetical protein
VSGGSAAPRPRAARRGGCSAARQACASSGRAAEVGAAERWLKLRDFAEYGASDPALGVRNSGDEEIIAGDLHTFGFSRARAAASGAAVRRALGERRYLLLRMFVAEGLSLRAMGTALGDDRRNLAEELAETLERLVEHYAAEQYSRAKHQGETMPTIKPSKSDKPEYRAPHDRERERRVRQLEEQRARDAVRAPCASEGEPA